MTRGGYTIIIPANMKPRPKRHEESAAVILSRHFKSSVKFLATSHIGTPDIKINGIEWEIKSIFGNSEHTIEKRIRRGIKQSRNIVIDLRKAKLHQKRALGYIVQFLSKPNNIKRLLVITKDRKVLVMRDA